MESSFKKTLVQHFSHEHPLEYTKTIPSTTHGCTCFGCKLEILPGKHFYKCKVCPFYLHEMCYDMPQRLTHPIDLNHQLTLLAMASPMASPLVCKACRRNVTGFYYNCATCGSFYHALCLSTPLSIKLPVHPHMLKLEFLPPYDFQCDICHKASYRGWLYRCGLCEFDAHNPCVAKEWQANFQVLPEPKTLDTKRVAQGDSKTSGVVMKLASEEMKGIGRKNDQGNFDFSSQSQDLISYSVHHDKGTPSESLFSIDLPNRLANSRQGSKKASFQKLMVLGTKDSNSEVAYIKEPPSEEEGAFMLANQALKPVHSCVTSPDKIGKEAITTGVKPHVWMELGGQRASSKELQPKTDKAHVGYQAQKPNKCCRYSFCCW